MSAFILALLLATRAPQGAHAYGLKLQAFPEASANAKLAAFDADSAAQDIVEARAAEEEAGSELSQKDEDVEIDSEGDKLPQQLPEEQEEALEKVIDEDLPSPGKVERKQEAETKTDLRRIVEKAALQKRAKRNEVLQKPVSPPPKSKAFGGKDKDVVQQGKTAGASPGKVPPAKGPKLSAYDVCEILCDKDAGMDGDKASCVTDCHTYVDSGGSIEELKDFVMDKSYNEKGGTQMEETFENITGEEVSGCKPEVDISKDPQFSELDGDGNGDISWQEASNFGLKMCIPDEMLYQIFVHADVDMNGAISAAEFQAAGEHKHIEHIFDMYLDQFTQGEDQYEPIQLPAFGEFDTDGDGLLTKTELLGVLEFELLRRIPSINEHELKYVLNEFNETDYDGFMGALDLDADGVLDGKEYNRGGAKCGMGGELKEAAQANEDLPDPDDLHRDPNQKPDPAVNMTKSATPKKPTSPITPVTTPAPSTTPPQFFLSRRQAAAESVSALAGHVAQLLRRDHESARIKRHQRQ